MFGPGRWTSEQHPGLQGVGQVLAVFAGIAAVLGLAFGWRRSLLVSFIAALSGTVETAFDVGQRYPSVSRGLVAIELLIFVLLGLASLRAHMRTPRTGAGHDQRSPRHRGER
jgi:hypothetical protein